MKSTLQLKTTLQKKDAPVAEKAVDAINNCELSDTAKKKNKKTSSVEALLNYYLDKKHLISKYQKDTGVMW